jgi:hypothetical protein
MREPDAVDALLTAWRIEPSPDLAGIVNAATRIAHTLPWPSVWAPDAIEAQAGALLRDVSAGKRIEWVDA